MFLRMDHLVRTWSKLWLLQSTYLHSNALFPASQPSYTLLQSHCTASGLIIILPFANEIYLTSTVIYIYSQMCTKYKYRFICGFSLLHHLPQTHSCFCCFQHKIQKQQMFFFSSLFGSFIWPLQMSGVLVYQAHPGAHSSQHYHLIRWQEIQSNPHWSTQRYDGR